MLTILGLNGSADVVEASVFKIIEDKFEISVAGGGLNVYNNKTNACLMRHLPRTFEGLQVAMACVETERWKEKLEASQ